MPKLKRNKPLGAPQGENIAIFRPKKIVKPKKVLPEITEHQLTPSKHTLRSRTALPDPFPDLAEKTRKELGLFPYGRNLVVSKDDLITLQNFYLTVRNIPMPHTLISHFETQHNLLRKVLGLVPLEDIQPLVPVNEITVNKYKCHCLVRKK